MIAGVQVELLRRRCQYTFAHHALQRGVARLIAVQQLGIDRGHGLAQALRLGLVCLIPLDLGDVLPIHRGHRFTAVVEVGEALDAEQHKGRDDQNHQETHQVLLVIANGIEHALKP